jgi:flagellar FliL protein
VSAKAAPAPDENKKKKKTLLIAIGAAVVLAGAGIGGWFAFSGDDDTEAAPARLPAQYLALTPAFVVNLADAGSTRYLQADVQLMTRDADTLAALKLHEPAIRNRLLLLFGSQSAAALAERAGKETLQKQALAEVRAALKAEKAPDRVDALYFTSLVTQ